MKICYDSYCKAVFVTADFIFGYWYCVEVDCVAGILEEHLSCRWGQCPPEIFATLPLSRATSTKVGSASALNPCESLKSVSSTYTPTLTGLMPFVNPATVDSMLNV
jgi:hypothetical protein